MKYQIKFIVALFIIASTYSCSSDFDEVDLSSSEPQGMSELEGIQVMEYTNSSPTSKGFGFGNNNSNVSFLSFPSHSVFKRTITFLAHKFEAHDDQFIANNSGLNNEQLSMKERQTGFDPYEPLKQFASSYNFNDSMLKEYIDAENNWLGKQVLDINQDPDNFFYNLDEEELAIVNRDGVVKIGNSIYKMFDGGYIEITDGSLQTLAKFNELNNISPCDEQFSINESINVNIVSGCGGGGIGGVDPNHCFLDGSERGHWVLANNRMIKGEVVLVYSPGLWGIKIKSKTKYFKQGWPGIWYRRRSELVAALDGKFDTEESNCGDYLESFDEKIHRRREGNKSKAKYVVEPNSSFQLFKIQNNKVTGFHYQKTILKTQKLKF